MPASKRQATRAGTENKADTRLRRIPRNGSREFKVAAAILDAGKLCHVGFCVAGQPYVVPMAYARRERELLLHGSVASRLVGHLGAGLPVCVTVTHLDGMVLARSAFNSSMNYRSVMVFGTAEAVTDPEAKAAGLDLLVDHLLPGRRASLRVSTRKELNATTLLRLPIETFSCKARSGPPDDPKGDLDQPVWAGEVPLTLKAGKPVAAPDLAFPLPPPACVKKL